MIRLGCTSPADSCSGFSLCNELPGTEPLLLLLTLLFTTRPPSSASSSTTTTTTPTAAAASDTPARSLVVVVVVVELHTQKIRLRFAKYRAEQIEAVAVAIMEAARCTWPIKSKSMQTHFVLRVFVSARGNRPCTICDRPCGPVPPDHCGPTTPS